MAYSSGCWSLLGPLELDCVNRVESFQQLGVMGLHEGRETLQRRFHATDVTPRGPHAGYCFPGGSATTCAVKEGPVGGWFVGLLKLSTGLRCGAKNWKGTQRSVKWHTSTIGRERCCHCSVVWWLVEVAWWACWLAGTGFSTWSTGNLHSSTAAAELRR